ncbi:hypothetical protein PV679_35830, partial [Streptomyces sp. AK02-01A]|nr:hypothetical protein [Streptomyces sp. AK02-01A]
MTPDYLDVPVGVPAGSAGQPVKSSANGSYWGAFPQSFVDFQQLTGQASYWFTSGGARDAAKPATPLTLTYTTTTSPVHHPELTVSPATGLRDGDTVTVTGSGYDTTTANPHGSGNAGAYVELGWIRQSGWQPSQGHPSSTRSNIAAVWVHDTPASGAANEAKLNDDGTFTVDLTVDTDALDDKKLDGGTLAVFTVAAGGITNADAEAYT